MGFNIVICTTDSTTIEKTEKVFSQIKEVEEYIKENYPDFYETEIIDNEECVYDNIRIPCWVDDLIDKNGPEEILKDSYVTKKIEPLEKEISDIDRSIDIWVYIRNDYNILDWLDENVFKGHNRSRPTKLSLEDLDTIMNMFDCEESCDYDPDEEECWCNEGLKEIYDLIKKDKTKVACVYVW